MLLYRFIKLKEILKNSMGRNILNYPTKAVFKTLRIV